MKHKTIRLLCGALLLAGSAAAQDISTTRKWDAQTSILMQRLQQQRQTRAVADSTVHFIITANDLTAADDSIRRLGGTTTLINDHTLTATFPLSQVEDVAAIHAVRRIIASRRLRPTTATARQLVNVDDVHTGTDLETPFTGKGVVIGVIDQGFQYRHPAFLDKDGNSRVLAVWNHLSDTGKPTETIPSTYDGNIEAGGHATHVTGIAAGTRYEGNPYYGMAPEADILMVPSRFDNAGLLEEAKWIKETAEGWGKPWVINMSFGANTGPHDGSTAYDKAMDAFCGKGGVMVAAMGNEGQKKLHVSATLAKGESQYLILSNDYEYNLVDVWGNATDGAQHFQVTPLVYMVSKGTFEELSKVKWGKCSQVDTAVDEDNNKQYYYTYVQLAGLADAAGATSTSDVYYALRIQALDDNMTFHAWVENGYGEFIRAGGNGITGNSQYLVSSGSASIPSAIGVASFNGAKTWKAAVDGASYSFPSYATTGAISVFTSPGPSLGSDIKPTIAAPGATICSAYNRYVSLSGGSRFDTSNTQIVCAVDRLTGAPISDYSKASTSANDFYGVMSGTSMATPAVSGIVALWLQANPNLTPADVVDIMRTTAVRDSYTGTSSEWTAKAGYGKIDAYNGLKAALQRATADGISPVLSATTPLTIEKGDRAWRLLFNTAVPTATIRLSATDGKTVVARTLTHQRAGDDVTLSLEGLTAGVYLLQVVTPQATLTRKVLLR